MTEKKSDIIEQKRQLWDMSHKNPEQTLQAALKLGDLLSAQNLTEETSNSHYCFFIINI